VTTYVTQKRVEFIDTLSPRESQASSGITLVYRVRTRASRERASADSNAVLVQVFPVPQKIALVETQVTESAIELRWAAPASTSAGANLSGALMYHVYRAEVDPAFLKAAEERGSLLETKSGLALLATSAAPSYQDTSFEFGKSYLYIVRSVLTANELSLESDDSQHVIVTPRDIFRLQRLKGWSLLCSQALLQKVSLSNCPGPSALKPIWQATASIEVSRRT